MNKNEPQMKNLDTIILEFLENNPLSSSKDIYDGISSTKGYATIKRSLNNLIEQNYISKEGKGKGTKYLLSTSYSIIRKIDIEEYFTQDIDDRKIQSSFNFKLISEILPKVELFSQSELEKLQLLQKQFQNNINLLSSSQYENELERLAIDLSWKSSQIEGNTYSLLETERLLKEKLTADGKTKEEAVMLLNHKEAIDFIIMHPDYLNPIKVNRIEDIHSILVKELGIKRNIRNHRVGISGTNYKPLDNEHQLREALNLMCDLVNVKQNVFEKALLLLVLLSYLQAFDDGNKRTARIVSNACLIHHKHCPISFRTVDSIEYKKAMLLFYEQNNISAFKTLFMEQFEFAVNTYF
ncbi:Fic family protein [Daejeonella sp.]|uniref:Fic family protein n=1 Tax=Daejeonella sp. TaxID=2805397 RepID=UPI0025C4123D|nr:Fic family protein [Daejeonella sp.]